MHKASKHVLIVGGGFGGLAVARALQHSSARVTLVDRNNYHVFAPLLYQVATGSVSPENITTPLRDVLGRRSRAQVLMGEVEHIDPARRLAKVGSQTLAYDALVVATGTATSYFGHAAWPTYAHGLKSLDDALAVRRQVLWALEQAERLPPGPARQAFLTFVVVGGGPTGVEMAGALANLLSDLSRARFRQIDPKAATILLVESGPRLLRTYAGSLSRSAAASLAALGVQVTVGARVTDLRPDGLTVSAAGSDRPVQAQTVVWAAGMQASSLGQQLAQATGAATLRSGRLRVGTDLSLPGFPELFVIGDLAAAGAADAPLPAVAPVATQMGDYVGRLLRQRFDGGTSLPPFAYRDLGSMAVIGRGRAVVDTPYLKLTGVLAWLAWLAVHLGQLHGKLNKVFVGLQWLMSFVIKRPSARAIFGRPPQIPLRP